MSEIVQRAIDTAPPMSESQKARIAALLRKPQEERPALDEIMEGKGRG